MIKINNEYGDIFISKNTIADIAGNATMACYGVVGMAHKKGPNGLVEIIKGEHAGKGVKVSEVEGKLIISLYIIVEFGLKISVVAENIIERVKYSVEKQTTIKVKQINVNVENVRI
jgi:uncharacterized alkaline shock family protein YloU